MRKNTSTSQTLSMLASQTYDELRWIARGYFRRERRDHTLQPTALVNQTYLRLARYGRRQFKTRAEFFGVVARAMRQILVEHARARSAAKRGGGWEKVPLDAIELAGPEYTDLLAVDEALKRLEILDPNLSGLVQLRYFGGLTEKETAAVLGRGASTIRGELSLAKAWLRSQLKGTVR